MKVDSAVTNISHDTVALLKKKNNALYLYLMTPAYFDDYYAPPESHMIFGEEGVRALRDFLNEHLDG